jgi:hypothetical protein
VADVTGDCGAREMRDLLEPHRLSVVHGLAEAAQARPEDQANGRACPATRPNRGYCFLNPFIFRHQFPPVCAIKNETAAERG